MHPHGTCDTGGDGGRHETARQHGAPGVGVSGPSRRRAPLSGFLAAVAAPLALPLQAQAQTTYVKNLSQGGRRRRRPVHATHRAPAAL